MILKVQQSLSSSLPTPSMLMYNEQRNFEYQANLTDEVKNRLQGRPKAYFNSQQIDGKIVLLEEVAAQSW